MSWYGVKQMSCTLCGAPFPMVAGELVNLADVICSPCVLALWDCAATEPAGRMIADVEARLPARGTMSRDILARAIVDRVGSLRDMARTRSEVEQLLSRRAVLGG